MARTIQTRIEIRAPAERVWQILTHFEGHPAWNPFIAGIRGETVEGASLDVTLKLPNGKGMRFKPKVVRCVPNQEFCWKGRLWVPGLFDGEHCFQIKPINGDRVEFVHQESFSGILVGLILRMIESETQAGFEAMNQALKAQAEKGASA